MAVSSGNYIKLCSGVPSHSLVCVCVCVLVCMRLCNLLFCEDEVVQYVRTCKDIPQLNL